MKLNAHFNKKFIHIDMDAFYASVEMRDNPDYTDIPLAVGGPAQSRGVISTCNYIARRFGIHSAMPTAQAFKLCPSLTLVQGNMAHYKEISGQIRAILDRYSNKIEPLSLDEAYIDVTECELFHNSATLIAKDICSSIYRELNLTASAGVAPLKFLAKIASDMNKPNGCYVIAPDDVHTFIADLPLKKISGVGKVFARKLARLGLVTGQDIRDYDENKLEQEFGKSGRVLYARIHGYDNRDVVVERVRKSVGVERTLKENITGYQACWQIIEERLYPELERRLKHVSPTKEITKQGIKIKFNDFKQTTIEHTYDYLELVHFKHLLTEIMQRQNGREIRLLGLSVTLKQGKEVTQLSLDL